MAPVREAIRAEIAKRTCKPGDRLLSEARLTAGFGVSRMVIREAVAACHPNACLSRGMAPGFSLLNRPRPRE
jgi:DNA-binding FadR family transcriptional regulator